jgi:phosphate uptake regulator
MLRKIIGATFKCGYDEIIVHFNSYDELKAVQDLLREQFSGFEIVSQTKNTLIIKNLSQSNFYEFDEALKRFFFVLNHMADDTADAIENNDVKWLKTTALLKIETDKFADYCRRAINMGFKSNFKRPAPLYTLIEQMEKVADMYRDICVYCSTRRRKASGDVKEILGDLIGFQNLFNDIFYKFDIEKMSDFGRQKENLQKKIDNALVNPKCSKEEMKVLFLIDRITNTIFSLNGPLMAVYL